MNRIVPLDAVTTSSSIIAFLISIARDFILLNIGYPPICYKVNAGARRGRYAPACLGLGVNEPADKARDEANADHDAEKGEAYGHDYRYVRGYHFDDRLKHGGCDCGGKCHFLYLLSFFCFVCFFCISACKH